MRVLVCGGRDFTDYQLLCNEMDKLPLDENQPITIIAGEARGADALAKRYAEECSWDYEGYPADWNTYGKGAGPIRNRQMLVEGVPGLVIAFPGGKGTENMISQAKAANVPTVVVGNASRMP